MFKKDIKISLIISSNYRSFIYLWYLKKNNFLPNKIVFLKDLKEKIYNKKINLFLKKNNKKLSIKFFLTRHINNAKVIDYLMRQEEKIFIVSLYPGSDGIIKNKQILKKKFLIHSHPGKLPKYKGSTTIYYSLLREKKIWCDTFFLNDKIDEGTVICSTSYPVPKTISNIDKIYDSQIRALNLIKTLKILKRKKISLKINKKIKRFNNSYYYVIHPVLRLLAFNKIKNV